MPAVEARNRRKSVSLFARFHGFPPEILAYNVHNRCEIVLAGVCLSFASQVPAVTAQSLRETKFFSGGDGTLELLDQTPNRNKS